MKNSEKHSDGGDPYVKSPRQKSLGDLLRDAREEMEWTRARLSDATNIGTSSIVRYELAGKEPEGQYPKAPTLAKLCIALKLDPLQVMLSCIPAHEYGVYEGLSNQEAWKNNHPQYQWLDQQLQSVTKDLMLLRSFISHFIPHIDRENLPDDLHWLLDKGETELDRISDLEARMLQLGVFILPFGHFLMPGGGTDEIGEHWIFDFGKPGVIQTGKHQKAAMIVDRTLKHYAERFAHLAHQFENLEDLRPEHDALLYRITAGRVGKPIPENEKSPEADVASPPSSENDET